MSASCIFDRESCTLSASTNSASTVVSDEFGLTSGADIVASGLDLPAVCPVPRCAAEAVVVFPRKLLMVMVVVVTVVVVVAALPIPTAHKMWLHVGDNFQSRRVRLKSFFFVFDDRMAN